MTGQETPGLRNSMSKETLFINASSIRWTFLVPPTPAEIMWNAVERRHHSGVLLDLEEAVTPEEALRAFTINPAHASGRASEEGSIEVGKRANIVVLDRNPLSCSGDELRTLSVERTYVDGELVYDSATAATDPMLEIANHSI